MARPSSPVAALANLVIKAYLKLTDPETAQFVVSCGAHGHHSETS